MKNQTCSERIGQSWNSTREALRLMLTPTIDDIVLGDDGSLDTVLELGDDVTERLSFEFAADYRDENGTFDLERFIDENDDIVGDMFEASRNLFRDYGLEFSEVIPDNGENAYWRYLMSWGGPQDELRFYVNRHGRPIKIEYWFLDWFDGAHIDVSTDEIALLVRDELSELVTST